MLGMAVGGQCQRQDQQELRLPVIGAAQRRGEERPRPRGMSTVLCPHVSRAVSHGRIGTPSSQLRKQERISARQELKGLI